MRWFLLQVGLKAGGESLGFLPPALAEQHLDGTPLPGYGLVEPTHRGQSCRESASYVRFIRVQSRCLFRQVDGTSPVAIGRIRRRSQTPRLPVERNGHVATGVYVSRVQSESRLRILYRPVPLALAVIGVGPRRIGRRGSRANPNDLIKGRDRFVEAPTQ